jgi:hypothetical protein
MTGEPPEPTLFIMFKEDPVETRTAYGISANVFLVFQGDELAYVFVTNAPSIIEDTAGRRRWFDWIAAALSRWGLWRGQPARDN